MKKEVQMNKYCKTISLLLIALVSVKNSEAQTNLPSDTFRVVKEFMPIIQEVEKIKFTPEINDTVHKLEAELDYQFLNKKVELAFPVDSIPPAKIKGEPLVKLYNAYLRLGVGNALVPFGELYYNNLRSKTHSLGTHISYFNQKELNAIKGSDRSQLHAEVFGKRFWKKYTLESNIGFDLDQLNYYGYHQLKNPEKVPNVQTPNLAQEYLRFKTQVDLTSTIKDSFNLRHAIKLNYNFIEATAKTNEQNILLSANLNQFWNQELYELDVLVDYNQYSLYDANSIIGLRPKISTIGEQFRLTAGLGIYVNAASETDFRFYPLADVQYHAIEDYLIPYAGVSGQVRRNNYYKITLENPFVAEGLLLGNTNEKFNLYGGFRGTLSKRSSFNLNASYQETEAEYFYVKTYSGSQFLSDRFSLIYDGLSTLNFKGEYAYHLNRKIRLNLIANYFEYETSKEKEAWHRPQIKLDLIGEYNLADKLIAKANFFYWGEQFAKSVKVENGQSIESAETLDGIIDLNLGFEYRYTKRLSAFIQFNNIAGIEYQKYQDYPTQGFNVLGGLTYSF